jgi:hypothetical protein
MPQPRRRRHGLQPDRVRALELLADAQDGITEALLAAHGGNVTTMVEIILAGLARMTTQRVVAI